MEGRPLPALGSLMIFAVAAAAAAAEDCESIDVAGVRIGEKKGNK